MWPVDSRFYHSLVASRGPASCLCLPGSPVRHFRARRTGRPENRRASGGAVSATGSRRIVESTRDSACSLPPAPTAAQLIPLARCRATTQQPRAARPRPAPARALGSPPPGHGQRHVILRMWSGAAGTAERRDDRPGSRPRCHVSRRETCARASCPAGKSPVRSVASFLPPSGSRRGYKGP
jgi:hypothetical protein